LSASLPAAWGAGRYAAPADGGMPRVSHRSAAPVASGRRAGGAPRPRPGALGPGAIAKGGVTALAAAVARTSNGSPVVDPAYLVPSRFIDLAVAAVVLLFAGPLMLLAAIAIRLTSRGPVFFRQPRAGENGRPFAMYKFRSMYSGAHDDKELFRKFNALPTGPCFKIKNDPRVTTVGRWLRRSSIDELPQLFNVLLGDMALVGPRPLPLDEVRTDTPEQRLRFSVKPGLTCLWQVCGRTEIPYAEWLALDVWYVLNRSLSLDLQILCKTFPAVLSGRGAY
jgi:lipopolysaccharide/colanic/teichoic acid biosynthesis glycosyltransferase